MRRRTLSEILPLYLALLLYPIGLQAQNQPKSNISDTNNAARRILNGALEKLGGVQKIRRIDSILIQTEGYEYRSAELQGYQPDKQTKTKHAETILIYPSAAKFVYEHRTGRHDGSERWRMQIMNGENLIGADFISNDAYSINNRGIPELSKEYLRRVPHTLLLEVSDNSSKISLEEPVRYQGRKHNVINFPVTDSQASLKLFFDEASSLLSKYEYEIDFPGLGVTKVEYGFKGYEKHPQLGWFPIGDVIRIRGEAFREVDFKKVLIDSPEAEKMFELPPHLAELIVPRGTTLEVAKGVFIAQVGPYFPMFIEFADFVLAVEAPASYLSLERTPAGDEEGSGALSKEFLSKIKEKVPDKPVKYLVTTHFHSDHAGGAREFISNGATILTTPGNKNFFERLAAAGYGTGSIRSQQQIPRIETFSDKKVISDSSRTVELINVGPNPHTAENIVVYLPLEKIVYQGDLFYFFGDSTFPPRSETTVMPFFSKWLVENGIKPNRIYGFHGRGFATMKHVEQILSINK